MSVTTISRSRIEAEAAHFASAAQLPILAKMTAMGWAVTELRFSRLAGAAAGQRIGVVAKSGANGWIEQDGTFTRIR